jgi:hypothetical protein
MIRVYHTNVDWSGNESKGLGTWIFFTGHQHPRCHPPQHPPQRPPLGD